MHQLEINESKPVENALSNSTNSSLPETEIPKKLPTMAVINDETFVS